MFPNSPFPRDVATGGFMRSPPPPPPPVLKPLRYCEFRTQEASEYGGGGGDVGLCSVFACVEILEMFFCFGHGHVISEALAGEGGEEIVSDE